MRRSQAGLSVVELAVVSAVALVVLFGCIEVGRLYFVLNTLAEATRRGARVAVVSATDGVAAKNATLAYAAVLKGMTTSHVTVAYYTETGGAPTGLDNTALVSVSISGYQHSILVPFLSFLPITVPAFATTLPVESMGIAAES